MSFSWLFKASKALIQQQHHHVDCSERITLLSPMAIFNHSFEPFIWLMIGNLN